MNKFRKCKKALSAILISSLMLLVVAFTSFASDGKEPIIHLDVDPGPIIATVFFVIGLFIAVLALLVFLLRHMSESRNRISRLSKIEGEETVQLYNDLDDAKWREDPDEEDKPRDVLLDDGITKNSKSQPSPSPLENQKKEEPRHGPVPERDMPGYDPNPKDEGEGPKPLSPMQTPPTLHTSPRPQAPMQPSPYSTAPYSGAAPAQTPYTYPQNAAPMVYRPDSDVEIIMRDNAAAPIAATPAVETAPAAEVAAPHKVRAYRRRGKMPSPAISDSAVSVIPTATDAASGAEIAPVAETAAEPTMPRFDMRHLNIGPLGSVGTEKPDVEQSFTLQLNEVDDIPAADTETVREAPILSGDESVSETAAVEEPIAEGDVTLVPGTGERAEVEIVPPRRSADETVVVRLGDDYAEKSMRTLDDVLSEMDDVDVTEIEAPIEPVKEEELIFLGADTSTSEDAPVDEVFDDEVGEAKMFVDGKYTVVRYRTSFMSRFIQAEELIQDYYSVLKNVLMSFEGVSSEIVWSCENFTRDEKVCAKLNVKENMLLLYLALDPSKHTDSKYHYAYAYDKYSKYSKYKNSKVSMMIKVKSDRALKYALELILEMMIELGVAQNEMQDIDYRHPYETIEQLIARGLVKILPAEIENDEVETDEAELDVAEIVENNEVIPVDLNGETVFDFEEPEEPVEEVVEEPVEEVVEEPVEEVVEEPVEEVVEEPVEEVVEEPVEEVVEEPAEDAIEEPVEEVVEEVEVPQIIHADAVNADLLVTDEEAIASIELVENDDVTELRTGKLCEVNLDSICAKFNDGDVVDLDALKAKHLVPKNCGRVKVLARGVMTKTLTIYADRFSLQAVKMIKLAGGHSEQYK